LSGLVKRHDKTGKTHLPEQVPSLKLCQFEEETHPSLLWTVNEAPSTLSMWTV
jgi:hypothetical protein